MNARLLFHVLVCLQLLQTVSARAQWVNNGAPVSNAIGIQGAPVLISDGSGGAIVVWQDQRSGDWDVYAQRIDPFGNAMWTANGVPVIIATGDQTTPLVAPDGAGGAIIAWTDTRAGSTDIYAQRINASGNMLWPATGAAICTVANFQTPNGILSDGAGGAIVAWQDFRNGVNYDIYVQRINSAGVSQWTAGGLAVCTAANTQNGTVLATDGAGGAILAWNDFRGAAEDVYAQRVNAAGTPQWTANGVAVCTAANYQEAVAIATDGAGGAILAWDDNRNGTTTDIYAARLNGSGTALWTANGQTVCTAASSQTYPVVVTDGNQGVIVSWSDFRSGEFDVYAQRMNGAGAPLWTADGVAVCAATGPQNATRIAADGAGGVFIAWSDQRGVSFDDYAQHITASGAAQWATDGIAVCAATGTQDVALVIGDGAGNAIFTWADNRSSQSGDIYAQRMEGVYGYWGHPEPTVTSVRDIRGDQGGKVAVNWQASQRDVAVPRTISYYDIWRAVDSLPFNMTIGAPSVITDLKDVREDTKGPLYYASPATSSSPPYYWELVGTQGAHGFGGYSFAASTRADSVAAGAHNEAFMVSAHISGDDYVAFTSNVLTGHSVDNLAPAAPLLLTAQRVATDVHLKWNGVHVTDLKNYSVYRASASGVTPIPVNFLANDTDTVLVDASAPGSALYYIVTANDVHDNRSAASNEAAVSATTGVGNLPPVTVLTVLQNHPNPFTGETQLQVGLPAKEDVRVEIYDVAGRRVRDETIPDETSGWATLRLEARDDRGELLPSGVYFYKVHAGNQTVTRKMVIAR